MGCVWIDASVREGVGSERSGGGLGKFTISGRVVDVDGSAAVDAEVMVGKTVVYTGANGEFELTVRKKRASAVVVDGRKVVSGAEIEAGELVTNRCGARPFEVHHGVASCTHLEPFCTASIR
jgi:hypothetical protein